jgi:hypothetical protein
MLWKPFISIGLHLEGYLRWFHFGNGIQVQIFRLEQMHENRSFLIRDLAAASWFGTADAMDAMVEGRIGNR